MDKERYIPPEVLEAEREKEKRQEVGDYYEGLKAMLENPSLPEEERAEIEEQIKGLGEAMEEAKKNNRKIYE